MSTPPRFPLTYRSSLSGRHNAAYCGNVRVGYVDCRSSGHGWHWQLIVLQPMGGAYWGKSGTLEEAKEMIEMAFHHWVVEAGLQQRNKGLAT